MAQTSAIVVTAITLPFWLFQVSVIIFLVYCRHRKRDTYCTTFFLLFIMLCVLDSFSEFVCFIGQRLIAFSFVQDYYISSPLYSSLLYLYSAYSLYTQCVLHLFIAINRTWNVYSILAEVPQRFKKLGLVCIFLGPLMPVPLLIPRMFTTAIYYLTSSGSLGIKYVDTSTQKYQSTASTCVIFFTAMPTFVLELLAILKYRQLLNSHTAKTPGISKKQFYQEYRLVCQALIVLVFQFVCCVCQALIYAATQTGNTAMFSMVITIYTYNSDFLNLVGPVALIAVSKHVRSDFIHFCLFMYGKRKDGPFSNNSNVITTKVSAFKNERSNRLE